MCLQAGTGNVPYKYLLLLEQQSFESSTCLILFLNIYYS